MDSVKGEETSDVAGSYDACLRSSEAFSCSESLDMNSTPAINQDLSPNGSKCECSILRRELKKVQQDIILLKKVADSNFDSSLFMHINDHETTTTLREENEPLRREVNILKARNTELTKEIKNLESEKASLVTSLRIL